MKESFDKKVKKDVFAVGDLVLRWDAWKEEKGKHGKFDNLWIAPFTVIKILGNNTFVLQNLNGEEIAGPINGRFLKYFHTYWGIKDYCTYSLYISFYLNKILAQ